jgi:hypothetical protein
VTRVAFCTDKMAIIPSQALMIKPSNASIQTS